MSEIYIYFWAHCVTRAVCFTLRSQLLNLTLSRATPAQPWCSNHLKNDRCDSSKTEVKVLIVITDQEPALPKKVRIVTGDPTITTNEKKKLYGITHNERGKPKCFNCSNFGHIARNCSLPKSVLTCRECSETGHKAINCVSKESKYSSDENLSVRRVGENSEESNSYLKKTKLNNCDNVQAVIDTGSSCCLLKIPVAQKFKLKLEPAVNKINGFGNQKMPALTCIGRIKAGIEVDNAKGESMSIYVVPDDAQSVDLIIGRT
ncbi:hypothetical protein AVEN_128634-1 [Araneus ventricosus]|uniref:CCHC-type domain-containing protein n=1 Tax=Araneus ventricosus TaxID=182803 RepID=A0A4Y2KKD9_ARAVE|nr:hypothetical protein AVEN_128634-1 [Araneus ventricosus]